MFVVNKKTGTQYEIQMCDWINFSDEVKKKFHIVEKGETVYVENQVVVRTTDDTPIEYKTKKPKKTKINE